MATKKELLLDMLQRDWIYLQIDGRTPGVDLPDWLRTREVTLQIGYDMPVPIHDLRIDDEGVTATLSFRRTPHTCKIPWRAIFALADTEGRGMIFPEDAPPDIGPANATAPAPAPAQPAAAVAASAEAVGENPENPGAPETSAKPAVPAVATFKSGRPRPSHLKLV